MISGYPYFRKPPIKFNPNYIYIYTQYYILYNYKYHQLVSFPTECAKKVHDNCSSILLVQGGDPAKLAFLIVSGSCGIYHYNYG